MNLIEDLIKPYRIWIEVGAAVAAVLAFAAFVHHERDIGRTQQKAAVQSALVAQKAIDKKDIDSAQLTITELQRRLDGALGGSPPPPAGDIHVGVCHNAVRSSPPSQDARASAGSNGPVGPAPSVGGSGPTEDSGSDFAVDLTPETRLVLFQAGARITYLQGYIKACQDKGFCAKEPTNASP